MKNNPFGTGAVESFKDPRTVQSLAMAGEPLIKGGIEYTPTEIEHQHKVGICTAICLTQNRAKANGKKYSADFQYLLQKKYYDKLWYEGSSILSALKVGKNIGFLPEELWTHTTEQDRYLPYEEYIAKLQAIPEAEIERLAGVLNPITKEWEGGLCVDKIKGYRQVNEKDPQAIAKAVVASEAGVLCMYGCGNTWWQPSWNPKDINPLRKPVPYTSGHAIIMSSFDYTDTEQQTLANTWGAEWCRQGNAEIDWSNYTPFEVWEITKVAPVIKYFFTRDLKIGMRGDDVKVLQIYLKKEGLFNVEPTGYFGKITFQAVKAFQEKYAEDCLVPAGLTKSTGYVGKYTRLKLESLYNN